MISVDSLLYKIDQKLNKLSTNDHQSIQLEDKILALNEAQISLIKLKVSGINVASGLGFDAFRKRYQDLSNLVQDYKPLPITPKYDKLNQWSTVVTSLSPTFFILCR